MEAERCETSMGCGGEKCMWSASHHSCQEWCIHHAAEWAGSVTRAIKSAGDLQSPAMLMVDRLSMAGQKGMFVRCVDKKVVDVLPRLVHDTEASNVDQIAADHLSKNKIETISMSVTICGLMGNPPQRVIDAWNSQCTSSDLLEFSKWMGFSKKCVAISLFGGNTFMFRNPDGAYAQLDEKRTTEEIASIMGDKSLKGTRMMFSFEILTSPWNFGDIVDACEAFDVKSPGDVNLFRSASGFGGRTFVYEPGCLKSQSCVGGGVHVSLDCGEFVAQWHTVAHMTAHFPIMKGGKASFKVIMFW